MLSESIAKLVQYGVETGLIPECERNYTTNLLLDVFYEDDYTAPEQEFQNIEQLVGGSILSHDHFQGGHYTFAMAKAPIEKHVTIPGFEDVEAGIVKWPLSVLRIRHKNPERLIDQHMCCRHGEAIQMKQSLYLPIRTENHIIP
mgnify:CR=1 FL=1